MYNKRQLYYALNEEPVYMSPHLTVDEIKNHPFLGNQLQELHSFAQQYIKEKSKWSPSYDLFSDYEKTGTRIRYEKAYFQKRRILMTFGLLTYFSPEESSYVAALEDIIWSICNEYTWCIPAHFKEPKGVEVPAGNRNYAIDLFSCETALALCEILHINQEHLSPTLVDMVKGLIHDRILKPFMDPSQLYCFEVMLNNWCAVCGGSIGSIALYLIEDKYELTNILYRVMASMDTYLDSFGDDGISAEGVSYWTYGFGFFTVFADLLYKKTDGKLNAFSMPKVEAISKAQQLYYVHDQRVISFSDSNQKDTYRLGLTHYLHSHYADMEAPPLHVAKPLYSDDCSRFCLSLRDFFWTENKELSPLDNTLSTYLEDAQWFISKTPHSCMVAKGGHNDESHNHNDVGSFIVFKEGEPLLWDLGGGVYDADYFSPRRYKYFCTSSVSHNLPLIDGQPQKEGLQRTAKNITTDINTQMDRISFNLESCYTVPYLKDFNRQLIHHKDDHSISLKDSFTFTEDSRVTERFISLCPIHCDGNKLMVKTMSGSTHEIIIHNKDFTVEILEEPFTNHMKEEQLVYIAEVHLMSCCGELCGEFSIK